LVKLTPEQRRLLEEPNLAHISTLMKDGSPQSTPLWVDYDGEYVLVNTAEGRQKTRNMRRDPRVTLSVVDRNALIKYVEIRGRVVDLIHDGAYDHLTKLAHKYAGPEARNPAPPEEVRVIVKIEPLHVSGVGVG
jgi:PPOX class probable F420-dependent enzyme